MTAQKMVVLGGSGFVGRHLANRLVGMSHRVTVPTRRRESAKHLLPLPTVEVVEGDIHDDAFLDRLLRDASTVVNLVGILNERRAGDFRRAHAELPRRVVEACRRSGTIRLLHMSALGADPSGPSEYQRTKAEGERAVAESGLEWTIFRPSVIFGREDAFLNLFAKLQAMLPVLALASPQARFQPVYVGDVAEAFALSVVDPATVGERYPLCGPKVYTLRELVDYVGELTGHRRPVIELGPSLSALQARILEILPGKIMSRDNLASMRVDNVCEGPFPAVFGIEPTPLETIAPSYLAPDAQRDRFTELREQSHSAELHQHRPGAR